MIIKDYIFQIFGEDYVAKLSDDRVYKVNRWGSLRLGLENGEAYYSVTSNFAGYNHIENNFYTAKQWEAKCLAKISESE